MLGLEVNEVKRTKVGPMLVQVRQNEVLLGGLKLLQVRACLVCVCAQGCMGAGVPADPWAMYLQQQRFLQQQQQMGHRVFDVNQIPVPNSPAQTNSGSSSGVE